MNLRRILLLCVVMGAVAPTVYAQDADDASPDMGAARNDVRISQLEEQVRKLQGALEQQNFQNSQLKAQLDKSNADVQYRIDALEKRQTPASPVAAATPTAPAAPDSSQLRPVETASPVVADDVNGRADDASTAAVPSVQNFANARDHYNYAFKILQQSKYAEAGASFAAFTQKYPKDQLIGNAYYWLGETFYVRHNYIEAADSFRKGYEAMPTGPKGADNLLRLAMTLSALNKDKEACVVLKQVATKLGTASTNVKARAEQEINRIGCN